MAVRIVIVDDHEIVREGIRTLITRSRPEWVICGEAASGEQAIEACRKLKPDIVVLDITLPGISGLEASSRITHAGLGCRILMFTMHESERLYNEVRQAGAQGVVLKSQAARDLIRAIDLLLAGGTFFEPGPAQQNPPNPVLRKTDVAHHVEERKTRSNDTRDHSPDAIRTCWWRSWEFLPFAQDMMDCQLGLDSSLTRTSKSLARIAPD